MSIQITSTDTETEVQAALGGKLQDKVGKNSASEAVVEKPEVTDKKEAASETAKEESEEVKASDDVEAKPKKSGVQKRIDKLSKRAAEAERKAAYWEQEAKRKQESDPKVQTKTVESPKDASKEPNPDEFERHSDYVKALVKWETAQREVELEKKAREKEVKQSFDSEVKSYGEREKDFKKSHPDFADRLESVDDVEMSITVRDRILKGGPELAYQLTEDPEEFKRICKMAPTDALEAIGEIKAKHKLAASKLKIEDEKPEVKTKPKPVSPVGSKASTQKNWESMSIKEYDAWRRAGNSPQS